MSDEIITRLVVGEPMTVTLGRPVGQRLNAGAKTAALRWKDGAWVENTSAKLTKALGPRTFQVPLKRIAAGASASRKYGVVAVASVAAISIGVAAAMLWRSQGESSLPIAPAVAASPGTVKVVTAPYAPEPRNDRALPIAPLPVASPVMEGGSVGADGPLPRPAPQIARSAPSTTVASTQPKAAGAAKASPPAKSQKDEQAPRVPAVLLDDPAPAAAQRAGPAAVAVAKPAATTSNPAVAAKPDQANKPPAARGSGLVAITPDGKSGVFTNPKTRLPEQFKVGDQLPNGETVRSVDYKEGRVVTSSKEYTLE